MRNSVLWLLWLVLPVFVLTYHYGPGQRWLARDHAATIIREAQTQSVAAAQAQEAAYESQLRLLAARREAFVAGIDCQTRPEHPLARSVIAATAAQETAYEQAAEVWHRTAELYGQATETLLKAMSQGKANDADMSKTDRQLLESLRWAEARAMVRSGEVFSGIEQLQALLDLRMAEAHQLTSSTVQLASSTGRHDSARGSDRADPPIANDSIALPTDAIREELAAAQSVGARLLREEGRPGEVWRPVANAARQHYRYLSALENGPSAGANTANAGDQKSNQESQTFPDVLDRQERMQRNLEQVLNLEQMVSDQLEGKPLPRTAPLARRPGDGEPGDKPGNGPGRGPLKDGPPSGGAGIPGPYGVGW